MVLEKRTQVLIIGGGPSGIAAAIASARNGAETLLVERFAFLGGVTNIGLCLHTFHSSKGQRIINGIPWEIISKLKDIGGTPGPVEISNAHMRTTTPIDSELFKIMAEKIVVESGAKVQFYSTPSQVIVEDNEIKGVEFQTKSGLMRIYADVIIDSTGDGDIAAWAGCPYEKGRKSDGKMQRMSLVFKMGGVDVDSVVESIGKGFGKAYLPKHDRDCYVWFAATLQKWAKEIENEGLFIGGNEFWGNSMHPTEVNINASRLAGLDGTNVDDLSRAEIEGRQQVYNFSQFLIKYVPGFEKSYLIASAPFIGVRETRRIMGEYVLNEQDVVNGRKFEDAIVRSGYPVDIHDPTSGQTNFTPIGGPDGSYDIPYRCFVPQKIDRILTAGRCISATHEAMASTRVMVVGMGIGQGVGTAAALCIKEGVKPRDLDTNLLRTTLITQGVDLLEYSNNQI
jgi:hypothetical protein